MKTVLKFVGYVILPRMKNRIILLPATYVSLIHLPFPTNNKVDGKTINRKRNRFPKNDFIFVNS